MRKPWFVCKVLGSCHEALLQLIFRHVYLFQVLVEGFSKRSEAQLSGRTDTMKRAIFDDIPVPADYTQDTGKFVKLKAGDYAAVKVTACSTGSLFAQPLGRTSLQAFAAFHSDGRAASRSGSAQPAKLMQLAAMA